jgi:hypothetical protein
MWEHGLLSVLCKWDVKREREKHFKNPLLPCLCICKGEEAAQCCLKQHCAVCLFFFFFEEKENEFGSDPKMSYDNTHAIRVYQHNFRIQFSPI